MTIEVAEKISIRAKAVEALEEAGGNWVRAAALLQGRIEEDEELRKKALERFLPGFCWDLVTSVAHQQRRAYWAGSEPKHEPETTANGLELLAAHNVLYWMDYSLIGGKRLGAATREVLDDELRIHGQNRDGAQRVIRFLLPIRNSRRMKSGKTVEEVFSENEIARIAENAKVTNG